MKNGKRRGVLVYTMVWVRGWSLIIGGSAGARRGKSPIFIQRKKRKSCKIMHALC